MAPSAKVRAERQKKLQKKLEMQPYLTDGELAEQFGVSVPTIRLDRLALGIPELRERLKSLAENGMDHKESRISGGAIVDVERGVRGIAIMETDRDMCFAGTDIVMGSRIYTMAETLAVEIMGCKAAISQVGNVKYTYPVVAGTRLVARGEVRETRKDSFILWVKVYNKETEAYRGKFIFSAASLENNAADEGKRK